MPPRMGDECPYRHAVEPGVQHQVARPLAERSKSVTKGCNDECARLILVPRKPEEEPVERWAKLIVKPKKGIPVASFGCRENPSSISKHLYLSPNLLLGFLPA